MHDSSQFVAFSRVRSLNGLRLNKLDCGKLTYENIANTDTIKEMERLRTLAKLNENFKFGNLSSVTKRMR
jgi:hypothetical protein